MTTKVGINGFGRIRRLAFRHIAETSKTWKSLLSTT